jgi:hypothetical protein
MYNPGIFLARLRKSTKKPVGIFDLGSEIRTGDLPKTKQECYQFVRNVGIKWIVEKQVVRLWIAPGPQLRPLRLRQ